MVLASGLPFEPAKVNKNWPRLAYGPAPAFGQTAEREYLDIYLRTSVSAEETRAGLEAAKPKGLELVSVERVPYALPSVQNLAAVAKYRVEGDFALYAPEETAEDFLAPRAWKSCAARTAALRLRRTQNRMCAEPKLCLNAPCA